MQNTGLLAETPSILIVDDDATIRLLMKDALADCAYNIHEFDNGSDALTYLESHHVDLVLLDVNMPGISGFDVCTEILKMPDGSDVSIVMVTALEDAASIAKSYDLGATDFISKPINWDTFPYRIQYLIKARNAIVETKRHKLHLEYMEHVSRIITQNRSKDITMQETMVAMLDIFSADHAFLIRPDENRSERFVIDCETSRNTPAGTGQSSLSVRLPLDEDILHQANHSEYPIIFRYNEDNHAPASNRGLRQQMLIALDVKHTQNWYLLIQQNSEQKSWTKQDEETFYKICLRITNMLSRYLLTERLSRSENLLKQAQKLGNLGNWSWNPANNRISWSDEVYSIYGRKRHNYTPDFISYFQCVFEEDGNRLNLIKDIQSGTSHAYKISHRIRTPDNAIRWVHEQCVGVYDNTGRLIEVNGIVQDITEAHNKKEREVHNNKMDAIGQLTSGIAHDFGNFMTVARGNLELLSARLSRQTKIDHEDLELLEDAYSAVNDSVELTKQLLAFSRKKSIAPVYLNVKETINKFRKLFVNTLGDTINLEINIDDKLPDILVDPSQFESTLLNLIINARNAMPAGGQIEISAQVRPTDASQDIIHNEDHDLGSNNVCIYVKDNGKGMSNDVLKRAIEPFYTTAINQGTGLGLSMVYGFMKQSRGQLVIRSTQGKGTTVQMYFPIYSGTSSNKSRDITVNALRNVQATILVVEDRQSVRQFAIRCLKSNGINILEAENATVARDLLKLNHVDLLFTDIVMPGESDGHDLANWASHEYPDLKILLTTAMESEKVRPSRRPHRFPLLPKPYSKTELIDKISGFFAP